MIVRIWKARARQSAGPRYVEYFKTHVVPELRAVRGYERAEVLVGASGEQPEIVVITWWASLDAIRGFAGDAIDTAVVHPAAAAMLTDFDRQVVHYEVAVDDAPGA